MSQTKLVDLARLSIESNIARDIYFTLKELIKCLKI